MHDPEISPIASSIIVIDARLGKYKLNPCWAKVYDLLDTLSFTQRIHARSRSSFTGSFLGCEIPPHFRRCGVYDGIS